MDDLAHPRRCTSLGPAGLSRDRATIEVRNIHPSHFGRLCSIETPEGKNVGVVNSLALGARADKYGFVLAPYIKVQNKTVIRYLVQLVSQTMTFLLQSAVETQKMI